MYHLLKHLIWLTCIFLLSGCGPRYVAPDQAAGFPYRHSDFDYHVAWKTTQTDRGVHIEGLLKNVRFPNVESVEVTVYLTGRDDAVKSSETAIPVPQLTRRDEVVPFSLTLKNATLAKGDLLRFLIRYKATEGGIDDGVDWRSTFIVDALTGVAINGHATSSQW